jgi:hypothetical protein
VCFYAPLVEDCAAADALDPDRDWTAFGTGFYVWVLQTYLRLRAAGRPVRLTRDPDAPGLVVAFHDHAAELAARRVRRDGLVVSIRADRTFQPDADVEVVQNRRFEDGRRTFCVPLWPQPGLRPRDPARGARVERVAFKGTTLNLHPDFRDPAFARRLGERGIELVLDEARYRGLETRYETAWNDYRDVDVLLAVRPRLRKPGHEKPPSKLVNAWLAGVPALLGPEFAFRDAGTPGEDYFEVQSAGEALRAIDRLRAEPELYARVVSRGRRRAEPFAVPALVARWSELLFDALPAGLASGRHALARRLPPALRRALYVPRERLVALGRERAQRRRLAAGARGRGG